MIKDSNSKPIKRLNLFDIAIMFFTRDGWIGLKAPKHARSHLLFGFNRGGLEVHRTIEEPRSHNTMLRMSHGELETRLNQFFLSLILNAEIDPSNARFRGWVALIPKTTLPDSPIFSRLLLERGREASLILTPLLKMGPIRALHELYDIIPFAVVKGRRFKWGLAYPTRRLTKFGGRTQRYLFYGHGRYFMISKRKWLSSLRQIFRLGEPQLRRS